ncbi:MAG TPA: hypothetical protein VGQ49_08290 [Bryobacteraceae bacterium]|nr:hypothetical protein [Bryobacteraceae bacterium]
MIEVYLFLAIFALQILGMSVRYPVLYTRFIRRGLKNAPPERLAELYPGVDVGQAHERFLARYRAANMVVVVVGLLLLGWFIVYMQRPNWDAGAVGGLVTAYFMLQCFPIMLNTWFAIKFNKVHRRLLPEAKRKATLQRRGLFDVVSPLTVLLAVLAYLQFVAVVFYVARHPFPGFGGPVLNIGILSLGYLLLGAAVMYLLYGRKKIDRLLKHADRMRIVSGVATYYAWILILTSILLSLQVVRKLVDLETWGPFTGTVFFLIITLLNLRTMTPPPRQPEADGLGSSPVR